MPDLVPRALVLWFFLAPDDVVSVRIPGKQFRILINRERIQLLYANDGYLGQVMYLSRLDQVVVNLAATKYDSLHCVGFHCAGVRNNQLKLTVWTARSVEILKIYGEADFWGS